MVINDKRDYLQRYRDLDSYVANCTERAAEIRASMTNCTPSYRGMPSGGGDSDKYTDGIAKIMDWEAKAAAKRQQMHTIHSHIDAALAAIDNAKYRDVIRLRYIDGMQWDDIAATLGYSIASKKVYALHNRALAAINL